MKLKLREIYNATDTLNRLLAMKMPAISAYRIARIAKRLNAELETFGATRKKTVGDALERHEVEQVSDLPEEVRNELDEQIGTLLDEVVVVDVEPWSPELFGDERMRLRPHEMMVLMPLIEEE